MANQHRTIDSGAIAPFGRIGQRLGFRWVLFWTVPIPFHPLLFHALPIALAGWLLWLAFGSLATAWISPLWIALILAIPLSVPFLQWILLAFRIHLIQAAMIPAAMALLGLAAINGEVARWLIVVPVLYFAFHVTAASRSRALLAKIEAEIEAIERGRRQQGALPPIILEGSLAGSAAAIMGALALPGIYTEQDGERRLHIRVNPDDAQLARHLAALGALPKAPVRVSGKHGNATAAIRVADLPADSARLRLVPWPGSRRRLLGALTVVELVAADGKVRRNYDGRAAPISWFPGFMFLFYLRLGAQAAYRLEAGVVRGRQRILGKLSGHAPPAAALAETLRDPAAPAPTCPDPGVVAIALDQAGEARVDDDLRSLEILLSAPATWPEDRLAALLVRPDIYADRAEDLVVGLERAREAKRLMAGITLARLIARLPAGDFALIGASLLDLLGEPDYAEDRKLPDTIRLADIDKLPFRGFGLLVQVPELYCRLGELGAPAQPVIEGLARRHGWRQSLADAYRAITGREPPIR